jgi:hypothetical protein
MTDDLAPGAPGSPDAPVNPPSPPAASGKQPGRWRPIVIIGGIAIFLAVVLFAVRNNVSADDLKVGDCFNIPTATEIQTVESHPCTESHTGEVILVAEYTEAGSTYPILGFDSFVETACTPAFATYVGRAIDSEPELSIGYFYPTRDGWSNDDRTITCYVAQPDESEMTQSVKGAANE